MEIISDEILAAVNEVMSRSEFGFATQAAWDTSWLNSFGFFLLALVAAVLLFGFFYFLKNKEPKISTEPLKEQTTNMPEVQETRHEPNPIAHLHALFLHRLQERKLITVRKWKTNADYIHESGNSLLERISIFYDQAIYGNKEISQESLTHLNEQFALWEKEP